VLRTEYEYSEYCCYNCPVVTTVGSLRVVGPRRWSHQCWWCFGEIVVCCVCHIIDCRSSRFVMFIGLYLVGVHACPLRTHAVTAVDISDPLPASVQETLFSARSTSRRRLVLMILLCCPCLPVVPVGVKYYIHDILSMRMHVEHSFEADKQDSGVARSADDVVY
jgi:hypothetical protein